MTPILSKPSITISDVKHGKMVSVPNVLLDIFSTRTESAAKSINTVKSSTEMLVFVNNATPDTLLTPMEHVKHGPTLIQLTTDVLNGKITNVKHALPNTILMQMESALP